jgi:hypothetical protein
MEAPMAYLGFTLASARRVQSITILVKYIIPHFWALSGHRNGADQCLFSGAKRTLRPEASSSHASLITRRVQRLRVITQRWRLEGLSDELDSRGRHGCTSAHFQPVRLLRQQLGCLTGHHRTRRVGHRSRPALSNELLQTRDHLDDGL